MVLASYNQMMVSGMFLGRSTSMFMGGSGIFSYLVGVRQGHHIINIRYSLYFLRRGLNLLIGLIVRHRSFLFVYRNDQERELLKVIISKKGHSTIRGVGYGGRLTNNKLGQQLPSCVITTDVNSTVVLESNVLSIPVVGLVDTANGLVSYPIISNNRSLKVSRLFLGMCVEAMNYGQLQRQLELYRRIFYLKYLMRNRPVLDFMSVYGWHGQISLLRHSVIPTYTNYVKYIQKISKGYQYNKKRKNKVLKRLITFITHHLYSR